VVLPTGRTLLDQPRDVNSFASALVSPTPYTQPRVINRKGTRVTFVDATAQRQLALQYAVELLSPLGTGDADRVITTAETLFAWLVGPAFLDITVGQIVDQTTKAPTGTTHTGGTMQLHDNEQCQLTVSEADAKGVALQDTLTWAVADSTVATLAVAGDTQSATLVAGLPGSTVVTVTDGALSATLAVDVVPGTVTTISIAAGTPEVQPSPSAPSQSSEPIQAAESGQAASTVDTAATPQ
jgi:hypothetical protein